MLVVRLGLFLSIAIWILTQWWTLIAMVPASGWAIDGVIDSSGYTVVRWPLPCELQFKVEPETADSGPRFRTLVRTLEGVTTFPGVMWASPRDQAVGLQHWLVASTFALVYVAIRRICQPRQSKPAGDTADQ